MSTTTTAGGVLCIGAAAVDLGLRLEAPAILGTSNLAEAATGFGGVARNVAELLARFGAPTALMTAVGSDDDGRSLLGHLRAAGVDVSRCRVVEGAATARYIAVLDPQGELVLGVNAMRITDAVTAERILGADTEGIPWLFAECNLGPTALEGAIALRRRGSGMRLAVDTISVPKATRLPSDLSGIDVLFTNADEANALLGTAEPRSTDGGRALSAALRERGAEAVVVTLGSHGHVVRTAEGAWTSPAIRTEHVVDVTGAGDALIAGTLAGLVRGLPLHLAAREGSVAASITTRSSGIAPPDLTLDRLRADAERLTATPMEGPLP